MSTPDTKEDDDHLCPYCGRAMSQGYSLIGGEVLFAQSTVAFGPVFASKTDIDRMLHADEKYPIQVIIGSNGFRRDQKNWPKPSMFCQDCLAIVVKVRNT